jgi:probable rRNA maturation factor
MERVVLMTEDRRFAGDVLGAVVVEIANRQEALPVNENRLRDAIRAVLIGEGVQRGNVSVAVVDDRTIQDLNRRFLNHDRPTDVLSFILERGDGFVEGEIIIGGETTVETAVRFGWSPADELMLYAIHGSLHLVGYDDQSADARTKMRARERFHLKRFGLFPRYEESQP